MRLHPALLHAVMRLVPYPDPSFLFGVAWVSDMELYFSEKVNGGVENGRGGGGRGGEWQGRGGVGVENGRGGGW